MNKLMTIKDLQNYLPDNPSIHTIYLWTSKKSIPHEKHGKKLFFEKSKIDKWIIDRKKVVA
jgi:hypothetical protein